MTPEQQLKALGTEIRADFEQFKKANDERLKLIESKGYAPADVEEKVKTISSALTKLEEKHAEVLTAMQRLSAEPAETPEVKDAKAAALARAGMDSFMRKRKAMGAEEHKAYVEQLAKEFGPEHPELKTLSVDSDPNGGYFVRSTVSAGMQKKIFESSAMRQIADSITISSDAFEEAYDDGEADAGWVGEQSSRSDTANVTVGMIRIPVHELHATPKATQKLLDDAAIDIEAWHAGKVAERFGRKEATSFVGGSGVAQPRGFLSYTAGDGFDKVEQMASGVNGSATADKLIELQDKLFEDFQANARWVMTRSTWTLIRQLKDANGAYLVAPGGNLLSPDQALLLGKPVSKFADMPEASTNGLALAYGDFKRGYLIVDRVGVRVLRDPYTSKGYVKFYTTKRVGGGVRHFQAIKIMKFATTL